MPDIEMDALNRAWRYGAATAIRRQTTFRRSEPPRLLALLGRIVPLRR